MPDQVTINEVGPRDGLQSQSRILSVAERLRLIGALEEAGISRIEAGSFVSPKAVPAMADTDLLLLSLNSQNSRDTHRRGDTHPNSRDTHLRGDTHREGQTGDTHSQGNWPAANYSFLIPNMKGYELAKDAGAESVTMVIYASETMARRNARMGMEDAERAAWKIIDLARADGIEVIVIVAVSFSCPFEGAVDAAMVQKIAARFVAAGIHRLVLADTIGAADPAQVSALLTPLADLHGAGIFGCHFHDTRAMALANVYAALQAGIRWFDSSIAGLGGCPFAPGASGNVATEDVVVMLQQMGLETGIDPAKLLAASDMATKLTGTAPGGRAREWLRKECGRHN